MYCKFRNFRLTFILRFFLFQIISDCEFLNFSSPEPKAHGELVGLYLCLGICIRASVRACVHIFSFLSMRVFLYNDTYYRIHMRITRSFAQIVVYKIWCAFCIRTPNFRLFSLKNRRSRKPMTIAKMIDNELQTAYKCQSM